MEPRSRIKVGIVGASGMVGIELTRLLQGHPGAELVFAQSRSQGGLKISEVYPHLEKVCEGTFESGEAHDLARGVDVLFLAVKHGEAASLVAKLEDYRGHVIDLTADHRLKDPALYPKVYGFEHARSHLLGSFSYGLADLQGDQAYATKHVANPGCFATACALSAAPLMTLEKTSVFFSAVTGSSGSGLTLSSTTHHPNREGNYFAYKPLSHAHAYEVAQALGLSQVELVTHSGPFVRGIYATMHAKLARPIPQTALYDHYVEHYVHAPFVRIKREPPILKSVLGSNFCDLHVTSRGENVVVMAAIDNLIKGAAGQAVQNFNLITGQDIKEGLWTSPIYP